MAVMHPEHVPEAIRIPPAPDASASTLPVRAPAQVAVRNSIVRLMSDCTRMPISKTMHPAVMMPHTGKHELAQMSGFRDQRSGIAKFTLDIDRKSTTIWLWIN
jgi:hypothetical protein